ncbi:MAG: hypothetical protein ACRDQD_03500 [Nocardioidaceae bacterium]
MKHSAKSTTAVVASVVGVLAGVGATLVAAQLATDPDGDPAPATTRVTGPPPPGPGHPYSPNSGPFMPDNADPSTTGPADVGGHVVSP